MEDWSWLCRDTTGCQGDQSDGTSQAGDLQTETTVDGMEGAAGVNQAPANIETTTTTSFMSLLNDETPDQSILLADAAENGDDVCLDVLLKSGANVNVMDTKGSTCLMKAARSGHFACVDLLLKSGDNVNQADQSGCTALIEAARRGDTGCADLLLKSGADVNWSMNNSSTALIESATCGYHKCVDLLLKSGAHVNQMGPYETTALIASAKQGHSVCVNKLLQSGAHVDQADYFGSSALMYAAEKGHWSCSGLPLNYGASVCKADKAGETALVKAVKGGHRTCTAMTLAAGKLITDTTGSVMATATRGHQECVQLLLKSGADVNTALVRAVQNRNVACVETLLKSGADANVRNAHGQTLLIQIAKRPRRIGGVHPCLQLMLSAGADVNASDNQGFTALITSAYRRHAAMVSILIKSGANVNQATSHGNTALDYAVLRGDVRCLQQLLLSGANVKHRYELCPRTNHNAYLVAQCFSLAAVCHAHISERQLLTTLGVRLMNSNFTSGYRRVLTLTFDRSLKNLCRQAIKRHLLRVHSGVFRSSYERTVPRLGLPTLLKDYVLQTFTFRQKRPLDEGETSDLSERGFHAGF